MRTLRLLVLCIAAAALGIGGASLASWTVTGTPPAASSPFVGELALHSEALPGFAAGPVWFDASSPGAPRRIDPATFLASGGDIVRMGHLFTLDAVGDNLVYELSVDWADPAQLPDGVTASYTLTENPMTDSALVLTDHVPLGASTLLPPAKGGTRTFLLAVELHFADDRGDRTPDETGLTDIGRIVIAAAQTREGTVP